MKRLTSILTLSTVALTAHADLITAVPGPDDQGGMLMPMVSIAATAGTGSNPTAGTVNISFNPLLPTPILKPLESWSPGSWFKDTAAWRSDIGSGIGVGGTPAVNAGNGDLFNNQYGFMFMSMGTMMKANIPTGKSLAIKMTSVSSPLLESYNYGNADNRWDQVFTMVGSQVLWTGSMWHNYFTLPSSAVPGIYTANFEVFIADTAFTGSTGFAQYDAAALAATADTYFTSANVTYTWSVIPEPATFLLLGCAAAFGVISRRRTPPERAAA